MCCPTVSGGPRLSVTRGGVGLRGGSKGAMRCSQGGGLGQGVRAGLLPAGTCERLRGPCPPCPCARLARAGASEGASEGDTQALGFACPPVPSA